MITDFRAHIFARHVTNTTQNCNFTDQLAYLLFSSKCRGLRIDIVLCCQGECKLTNRVKTNIPPSSQLALAPSPSESLEPS
jgi:hypothetical protein